MFGSISNRMQSAWNHATFDGNQRAENLGFINTHRHTAEEVRDLHDQILPSMFSWNGPDSNEMIELFKEFGGWTTDPITEQSKFADSFKINSPIREQDEIQTRWLDVAAQIGDKDFQRFLLENGAVLESCLPHTQTELGELAATVGLKPISGKTSADLESLRKAIVDAADGEARIALLKAYGGYNETTRKLEFDVNSPFRIQGGKEYRWLDLASKLDDEALISFLLKNAATRTDCLQETRDNSMVIKQSRLLEHIDTESVYSSDFINNIAETRTEESVDVSHPAASLQFGHPSAPPVGAGSPTSASAIGTNAATASGRHWGIKLDILLLPLTIAGASLYAASIGSNVLISIGYFGAQMFASLAVLPCYVADKGFWGGVNLARACLGYTDKVKTHYYLTKTFGGLACLTGLAAVALCTLVNPVSLGLRAGLISNAANLGAHILSFVVEGNQDDKTHYQNTAKKLNEYFESSQPDRQWKNWSKLRNFVHNLATERGFKENYAKAFATQDASGNTTNAQYDGILSSTVSAFAFINKPEPIPIQV